MYWELPSPCSDRLGITKLPTVLQVKAVLSSLQVVAACFPLPANPDTSLLASESEIAKLHWLGQEHLEAEVTSLWASDEQGDADSVGSYEASELESTERCVF